MPDLRRLLPLLLALVLPWACTDGEKGPAGPSGSGSAHLLLGATFEAMGGESAQDEIVRIRLTVLHAVTDEVLQDPVVEDVDPEDPEWSIELEVPVPQDGAAVRVLIELIDATGETEWSGLTDPIEVRAGQTTTAPEPTLFPGPPGNLSVDSISVAPAADTLLEEESVKLTADVFGGDPDSVRVVWASLTPALVTVAADGTVTALLPGTARIEAAAGPARDTATIEVLARISAVLLAPEAPVLTRAGERVEMEATVVDGRGEPVEGQTVSWSIDDEGVATHVGGGVFEAVGEGTAEVTATVESEGGQEGDVGVEGSVLLTVAVPDLRPVSLEVTSLVDGALPEGEPVTLRVRVTNEGGSAAPATGLGVGVLDPETGASVRPDTVVDVAALEPEDTATVELTLPAPEPGDWPSSVTFRAIADHGDAVAELDESDNELSTEGTTLRRQVSGLVLTPAADTLIAPGDTARFTAALTDALGEPLTRDIAWSSLDPAVATVDTTGLATASGQGSARIVASAEGVADTATLVVLGQPDLLPENLVVTTPAPDTVAEGHSIGIAIDVRNAGGSDAPATTLALRALDAADLTLVDDTLIAVPALTPGGTFHFEDVFDLAPEDAWPDRVVLEAVADASADVAEADETNNAARTGELVVWRAATSIEITPAADTVTAPGDTARFGATMHAFDGTVLEGTIGWTSLDPEVATVDETGLATAVASGSARIVAVAAERGGAADTATLVVLGLADLHLSSLTVGPTVGDTIIEGDTLDFSGTIRNIGAVDAPGTVLAVRFLDAGTGAVVADSLVQTPSIVAGDSTSFLVRYALDAVASWPPEVTVEAVADAAEALVETSEENNTGSPEIVFTVRRAVSFVVVSPSTDMLAAVGDTTRFTATAFASDETALDRPAVWSVLDPTVASVDGTGLVTASEVGSTTVFAVVDGVEGSATVVVASPDLAFTLLSVTTAEPGVATRGDTMDVAVEIMNLGPGSADATQYVFRVLDWSSLAPLAGQDTTFSLPALAPGATFTAAHRLPVDPDVVWPDSVLFQGEADPALLLPDPDRANNTIHTDTFDVRESVPAGFTQVWTGAGGTAWSEPASWEPAHVPTTSDTVLIRAESFNQPVLAASVSVGGLTVESGAGVDVGTFDLTVGGDLDAGATVVGTTGRVIMTAQGGGATLVGSVPDLRVHGNVVASGPVTVAGSVVVQGQSGGVASFDVGAATVDVAGDFTTDGPELSRLIMQDGAGVLRIAGNASFNGAGTSGLLTAGSLEIGGDFFSQNTQNGCCASVDRSFQASGTHTTVFNGTVAQILDMTNGGFGSTDSRFQNLDVDNAAGVTIDDNGARVAAVAGDLTVRSGSLLAGLGRILALGALTTESASDVQVKWIGFGGPMSVAGTFSPDTTSFRGSGQVIQPGLDYQDVLVHGTALLTGATTIAGDVVVQGLSGGTASFDVGAATVDVGGSFTTDGPETSRLIMQDGAGVLRVAGNASFNGAGTSGLLTAGRLEIGGDFFSQNTQAGCCAFVDRTFQASGTHTTVFNGTVAQTLDMTNGGLGTTNSRFQNVEIDNATGVFIDRNSTVRATVGGGLTVRSGALLSGAGRVRVDGSLATESASDVDVAWLELRGPMSVAGTFSPDTMDFRGTADGSNQVVQPGLSYQEVRVHAPVVFTGGTTIAGSVVVQGLSGGTASFDVGAATVDVAGSFTTDGPEISRLIMQDAAGVLRVAGNASFNGAGTSGLLTAGRLEIGGDFFSQNTQAGCCAVVDRSFQASSTHTTVFNGTVAQTLDMTNGGFGSTDSRFQNLEFGNASGVTVIGDAFVNGSLVMGGVTTVSTLILVDIFADLTLATGATLTNDGTVRYGGIFTNLDGTINGNEPVPR